ncbi:hypothetical protein TEA_009292 [Camellia sinensis var. sinensis]|uniref:DYW domain-containing protein n=1 Tax=Camellia sinensis var. sinensis TaxID=542762 RepID=A0A4S4EU52_CAMSN|nr:hypothetical protein TEA_009292 [Camellia sinensis var. sinensis]
MRPAVGNFIPAKSTQNPAKTLLSLFPLTKTLSLTQQLHSQIILNGLYRSLLFGSKLSNSYIQLGFLQFATKAFDFITVKNSYSYNTIASGFFKNKRFSDVLRLFKQMRTEGCSVDSFNLAFAIKSCIGLSILQDGKLVHCLAIKSGLDRDPYLVPVLIDVYSDLGSLKDAQKLFEEIPEWNSVIWGSMMKGYLKSSEQTKVFELFLEMRTAGFELDPFTSECLVRACGNVSAGKEGKSVHGFCIKHNFMNSNNIYLQTSLVDMYLNCDLLDFGLRLFKGVSNKDVVLWTAMVAGFAKNGRAWEAISLFRQMLGESMIPNSKTLASIILACSHMGSLQQGKTVFMAHVVFKEMPMKNVFSWTSMINGFGMHGLLDEAIAVFDQMISDNQLPNSITFVSLLSACSHSGRVEEGWNYFKSMSRDYGITPMEEHFASMVDLLGRAGKIDEALSFISDMPREPGASAWGALLSACRIHKRLELAEEVAKRLLPLEPDKSAVYVLLGNIYGDAGLWEMVKKMRLEIGENGLHKSVGFTSVEVDTKLYVFSSNDKLAKRDTEVEVVWTSLHERMRELGYVPDISFVVPRLVKMGRKCRLDLQKNFGEFIVKSVELTWCH